MAVGRKLGKVPVVVGDAPRIVNAAVHRRGIVKDDPVALELAGLGPVAAREDR